MVVPLVSVIIPTHNRNHLLKQAILSVYDQTFKDYEIIVVDDTWSTLPLYKNHPAVRFIHIPQTPYPGVSRNVGIKAARGKYIAFLDDDDYWYCNKLKRQISFLKQYPEIGLVCSNGNIGKDLYIRRKITNIPDMLPQEITGDFVVTSSCVIRKSILDKTGLYSPMPLCEDYDFSIRFAAISGIFYDPSPLFEYTVSGDSIQKRNKDSFTEYHRNILQVMKNLQKFLKENNRKDLYISLLISYRIITEHFIVLWNIIKDKIRGANE